MPNGGSGCCGTCWFNRRNRGERDWMTHHDESIPPSCEIRDVAIDNPFYDLLCPPPAPHDRDRIPIGPIMRHGGFIDGLNENPREVWIPSPDSEEIRLHLLELLENFFEHIFKDKYIDRSESKPGGPPLFSRAIRM